MGEVGTPRPALQRTSRMDLSEGCSHCWRPLARNSSGQGKSMLSAVWINLGKRNAATVFQLKRQLAFCLEF